MVLAPAVQVLLGLLIVSAMMTVLWFVQRRTGNAGIVDAGWAAGIGLLGVFYAATSDGYLPRRVLVAVLIGIWSARLAIYFCWTEFSVIRKRVATGRCAKLGSGGREKTVLLLSEPGPGGFILRPARAGRGLSSGGSLDGMGSGGRADLVRQRRQYRAGRPATRPIQAAAGKPRQDLPRGLVALLAPPELLLRVAALVVLCGVGGRGFVLVGSPCWRRPRCCISCSR